MATWKPIETAPKDGRWILLRGGSDKPSPWIGKSGEDQPNKDGPPAVVGFWHKEKSYEGWTGSWMYCHWDSDWRSSYDKPTEWTEIPE